MKFLVDNQLPIALARHMQKRGLDCEHVVEVGLAEAVDRDICQYATEQERIIISKDEDFLHLAGSRSTKFRFVWVRLGNCRTSELLSAFDQFWPTLEKCLEAGDRIIEFQ